MVTERNRIPEWVLDSLSNGVVPRLASRWVTDIDYPLEYPIEVPVWLANIVSSIYHSPRVARQEGLYKSYKDFQSHYLSLSSKLLLGET